MAFQYGMLMQLSIMLLGVLVPAATTRPSARQGGGAADEIAIARPACKDKCGNIEIPYPFGIGQGCYFGPKFEITCNESNDGPTEPRLMETRMLVDSISLAEGRLQIRQLVNRDCYDAQGKPSDRDDQSIGGLSVIPPYTISSDKNWFFVVGCDTYAHFVGGRGNQSYTTGCISKCDNNPGDYAKNDICSGMGCCRTKIPPLLNNMTLQVASYKNHTEVHDFNPCGYAFFTKMDQFKFNKTSFKYLSKTQRLPLVLDWQIGDESCENARKNKTTFACKGNSDCHDKTSSGYICLCKPGYQGNPYLEHSCRDIDECASNSTLCKHGKCKNKDGYYTCVKGPPTSQPKNNKKSPPNNSDQKKKKVPSTKALKISLGTSLSFLVLLVGFFWKYLAMKNIKFIKLKRKYLEFANGGKHFTEKLARTFTEEELKVATRTFTEEEVKVATKEKVGEGGFGIVYKGILDTQAVAIKKLKFSPPFTATEPFVNEMIALSQINHTNVVRLVGCCFETRTPILVYEFIAGGTLYDHIHRRNQKGLSLLSLALRLKIAAEAADALADLHDSISPIIHGDVKTTNILLEENYMAKVSDFGASRLVPEDENQISTLVKGTQGYLDPQYLQSNTFTEKSDVYSFGVVLAELLTSRKAVSLERPGEERNLANVFVSKVESSLLDEILDREIVEGHLKGFSEKAADLAIRCLRVKREERPHMKEVATELHGLVRTMEPHSSGGEANISPSPKDTGNLDNRGDGDGGDGADCSINIKRLSEMGDNCFTCCSW